MRVLVIGGSGYLGSAIVRALVAGGHKVTGLSRSTASANRLAKLGAHARPGSLEEPESVVRAADGHEGLIHVAAVSEPERARKDRALVFALIDAARRSGESRTVIYTSGVWALGAGGGDEGTPIAGLVDWTPGVRLHAPARASAHRPALERDVLAAATEKVATAVVRPGMVYGGAGGLAPWLVEDLGAAAGHPGTPTFVGDGANRWSPVHCDDNAQLYKMIVERHASGIFHAVEDQPLRVADLAQLLADAGKTPPPFAWDRAAAEAALGDQAEALSLDIPAATSRSRSLGWQPTHRFAAEVDRTWSDFLSREAST
jgi:nucleoside-diphosphate-sugar epimerase